MRTCKGLPNDKKELFCAIAKENWLNILIMHTEY